MMQLNENQAEPPPGLQAELPSLQFSFDSGRLGDEIQRYVSGVFQISYGAQVKEFMPLMVCLREQHNLTAALGLRGAAGGRLFCEQYLDEPVEHHVKSVFGQSPQRGRILEMGNLVASNPGHAALLYTLVGVAMYEAGVDYLLFTANRAVRISLQRSGIVSVPVARADRNRLGAAGAEWGSYYNGDPRVMLGDVRAAMGSCMAKPLVGNFLKLYQQPLNQLVDIIQSRLK